MKKTTYVLIGMVVAGFAVIALVAGLAWMLARPIESTHWVLGSEQASMEIPACRVWRFEQGNLPETDVDEEQQKGRVYFEDSSLEVIPAASPSGGRFTFPADLQPCLSQQVVGDTCIIRLQLTDEIRQQYMQDVSLYMFVNTGRMQLHCPEAVASLTLNWTHLPAEVRSLQCDSLQIQGSAKVHIQDCRFGTLCLGIGEALLNRSQVGHLHVDLDRVYRWVVQADSCEIGVEHLTGSGNHHCLLQKGESDELRWMPKTEDATLAIQVENAVVVKSLQEECHSNQ